MLVNCLTCTHHHPVDREAYPIAPPYCDKFSWRVVFCNKIKCDEYDPKVIEDETK